MAGGLCPRCGKVLPPAAATGRPRVWCSSSCRAAAAMERRGAAGAAVRVVEVERDYTDALDAQRRGFEAELRRVRSELATAVARARAAESLESQLLYANERIEQLRAELDEARSEAGDCFREAAGLRAENAALRLALEGARRPRGSVAG